MLAVPFVLHESTSETCQRLGTNELVTHAKIEEKMKRMNAKTAARSLNEIFFHRIPMPLEFTVVPNADACEFHADTFLIALACVCAALR